MGFLLGAFGKLAAGRRMRQIQSKMMRVQSRLRRATRQASDMEKMLQRQEKTMLNSISLTASAGLLQAKGNLMASIFGTTNPQQIASSDSNLLAQFNQQSADMASKNEMAVSIQKQQIEDYFEYLRESMLEPLKDEEESLQTEKDSLESQLQIAQADYEACKKMEQSDAKNLAPNYTGAA